MKPGLVLATLPLFPGNLRSFHMSHKIITATLVLKRPMRALQGLKCLDSHHKSQWKEYYPCVKIVSIHMPPLIIFRNCPHFSPHDCFMQVRLLLSHHSFSSQSPPGIKPAHPYSLLSCIASPSHQCPLQVDDFSTWSFVPYQRLNCSLAASCQVLPFLSRTQVKDLLCWQYLVQNDVTISPLLFPPAGVKKWSILIFSYFNLVTLSLVPPSKCVFFFSSFSVWNCFPLYYFCFFIPLNRAHCQPFINAVPPLFPLPCFSLTSISPILAQAGPFLSLVWSQHSLAFKIYSKCNFNYLICN